ncbi:MAG: sodium/solute symporter [Planctomycetes bacterium]|nr:sodium/solute symporter [Planctomycetota bacterium]
MGSLHWADLAVLVLYVGGVLWIGWIANRRQKTAEDYYLGGRRMAWWAIGISILANSYSATSLVGGTGMGYGSGFLFLQRQLGDLVGFSLVAVLFLPFFSRLGLTSAYEYLEKRFGVVARTFGSLLFLGQTLLRAGLLIHAPAYALAGILGWSMDTAILVASGVSIVYCALGGLEADVWTDVVQLAVIVLGIAISLVLIVSDVGSVGRIAGEAASSGKLAPIRVAADPRGADNLVWVLLAYSTVALAVQGTNQQSVQRYMSCRNLAGARRAAMSGWAIGVATTILTLAFGVALSVWSTAVPGAMPEGMKQDAAFGTFLKHRVPPGLAGLLVAAVFAAAMSSIDSAIQSMSTATIVDFVKRFRKRPLEGRTELRLARTLTGLFGLAAAGIALYAAHESSGMALLDLMVTWIGYFAGPLLGLFLLGMLTRRANQKGAVTGAVVAFACVALLVVAEPKEGYAFHALWFAPFGLAATFVVGLSASCFFPEPPREKLAGLSLRDPDESSA